MLLILIVFILVAVVLMNRSANKKLHKEKEEYELSLQQEAARKKQLEEERMSAALKELEEQERKKEQEARRQHYRIPDSIDGYAIEYEYPDVSIVIPDPSVFSRPDFSFGCGVDVVEVPPGSPSSAAISIDGDILGYLPKNRLSGMVADWHHAGKPVRASVSRFDPDNQIVTIRLVFFGEDRFEKLVRRNPDAKTYKLVSNLNEDMQSNISLCKRGEKCSLYYDYDKEKYLVSSNLDIGYLPASASRLVEEYGEDVDVYIAEIGENDNLKYFVRVYIFD